MYAPALGRWTQNDPIEFEAGDPNLYRFVGNNPTNHTDPSGLMSDSPDSINAKLKNAIAKGDAEEVKAVLKTIQETAPDYLTPELKAAAERVIQRQVAKDLAISESIQAQNACITGKSAAELNSIRGSIMRAFFKGYCDPAKTEATVAAMRSYQQVAKDAIALYRRNAARESGAIAKKWEGLVKNQEGRLQQIAEWLAKHGLEP